MDKKIFLFSVGLFLVGILVVGSGASIYEPAAVASGIEYVVYQEDYNFYELRQFNQGNPEYVSFYDGPPVWGWMNFFWDPVPGFPADGTVEVFLIKLANQVSPRDWIGVKFAETSQGENIRTVRFNLDSSLPRGYVFQLVQNVGNRQKVVWQTSGSDSGLKEITLPMGVTNSLEFRVRSRFIREISLVSEPVEHPVLSK